MHNSTPWSVPIALGALSLGTLFLAPPASSDVSRHPVLDHGVDPERAAEYEAAVERVMGMSEEEMLSLVPEKHFTRFCECPKCQGGTQGDSVFAWSIDEREKLTCRYCSFVWTPDGECPEDQILEGKNQLGETRTYTYYESPEHGTRHFFSQYIDYHERLWTLRQAGALGRAWLATGKSEYARRVALILDKIASVYPHLAVVKVGGMPNRYFRLPENQNPPYTWDAGKWGWHSPGGELPGGVTEFYDMVYDSPELDSLSQERGYDVRERIESDFLRPVFEAVRATPSHISNYVAYLSTAVNMGRVIGEPSWVHWAVRWIGENVNAGCFYDGMWHESPSYHYMTVGGLRRCFASVRGYSDPPGYVDAADGKRFDDFDPDREFPFWARVQHAPEAVDFPTGCSAVVHDTWSNQGRSEPREATRSAILPGFGHASLGRGTGPNQLQAQLHFSGAYGHHHRDNLNLCLWAKGREMLSDIGYTWTDIRPWTTSTISHNLVAVDGQEQGGRPSDGDLLHYFPDVGGVSMVEADGVRGYANVEGLDIYRRVLVLVPVSDADAYVLDVFRVRGGMVHDWLAHGDADEDMTAECSLPLGDERDTMLAAAMPPGAPEPSRHYEMIKQARSATANAPFTATFRYVNEPSRGLRIHLMPGAPVDVFLGRSPSVRRSGTGNKGDSRLVYDFWMPHLIARRHLEDARPDSTFMAIEEAFAGEPFVSSALPVAVSPEAPGVSAVQISHGPFIDTVIATIGPDVPPGPMSAAGVELTGRLGIVRRRGDEVIAMWLLSGSRLACGGSALQTAQPALLGTIGAATRKLEGAAEDAFITDADLPVGDQLRGVWMVVTHANGSTHGYEIDHVAKRDGRSAIVLAMDHGLMIDGTTTREVYFPRRTFDGANGFVIPNCAASVAGDRQAP